MRMGSFTQHMLAATMGALFWAGHVSAETIAGDARLLDGDTIAISDEVVRLLHIDAPESDQLCQGRDGQQYFCGKEATDVLRRIIDGRRVTCQATETDQYGRWLGICSAAGVELNQQMITSGWAVRYDQDASAYLAQELDAAKAGRGIWQGGFLMPKAHRKARWEAAAQRAPTGCPIKGNISSRGRIYHTPWSRSYDRTRISASKGERWFCSEADAIAAGWRAPYR